MRGTLYIVALFLLSACDGIFDSIYDKPTDFVEAGLPYGYKSLDTDSLGGTLFFNSTCYTRWTYFNLREVTSDTIDFTNRTMYDDMVRLEKAHFDDNSGTWDIAVHRSVPKTNGGAVAETRFASVGEVVAASKTAGGLDGLIAREGLVFEQDVWSDEMVTLDLSDMLQGRVVYQPSYYNDVLNRWLSIDISNPPPVYTMSNRAYILRLQSGEYYALRMSNFRNSNNITAWLTIDFRRL